MHPKSFDCELLIHLPFFFDAHFSLRTDKAVLAVNGFAADGNMFVKRLRQRLEVSVLTLFEVQS